MKKFLKISSTVAILFGIGMICVGAWGISFTYKNIAQEKIVTAEDASIPNTKLSGPFTLKSEADIIREHTLKTTGGKTFAEMPRQIAKLDSTGKPILDKDGKAVMIPNDARNIWITATTLITALHLGIFAYVFSGLVIFFGLLSLWIGIICIALSRK